MLKDAERIVGSHVGWEGKLVGADEHLGLMKEFAAKELAEWSAGEQDVAARKLPGAILVQTATGDEAV
jgi:hypothetical protein